MGGAGTFAIVIVIAVLVMVLHGARLKFLKRDYMFGNLGKRFQGRRYRSNLLIGPRFVFSYGQPRVVVSWNKTHGGCVQLRIDWPEPDWRFQLTAQQKLQHPDQSHQRIEPLVEMLLMPRDPTSKLSP